MQAFIIKNKDCAQEMLMNKRTSDRINKSLNVIFPCCRKFYSGTATNFSENGMLITTDVWVPMDSTFDVLIPFKEEVLKVPVQFVRLAKTGKKCRGMGVKLLNLPKKYLELLIRYKFNSDS